MALEELERVSVLDIKAIKAGREEDAILMNAALEGWDYRQYIHVMQYRDRHYRMMLSLVDKWLEIQGIAALRYAAFIALARNNKYGAQKVMSMMEHNRA